MVQYFVRIAISYVFNERWSEHTRCDLEEGWNSKGPAGGI